MKFLLFCFICSLVSCSYQKPEDDSKKNSQYEQISNEELSQMDTDGDRINDLVEKERGLHPFVANIPELKVNFLQNYSIKGKWKGSDNKISEFTIDTRTGRNDPEFRYRIGEILVREKAFTEAARIGRYSGHSWGDVKEEDLNRVGFPEVDTKFAYANNLKVGNIFNNPQVTIESLNVELENSVKLTFNSLYSSIRNLEINFYYFDHETESYELLATKVIERHFLKEVNESFNVTLENVPYNLISDSYLKRGEFIISEIKDYEIPELGIKYSELMKSVKSKTVHMVMNTPLETRSLYVAPFKNKNRFTDLMDSAFPKQFKLEEDVITKVGQFESNLQEFTHLKEVKSEDKKGKWFVHTRRLLKAYLDHEYQNGETIILSYLTGKEISEQSAEKINSLRFDATGGIDFDVYSLGNVSPNSLIDFQLSPGRRHGDGIEQKDDRPVSVGGSCGKNCYRWDFQCHIKINKFYSRYESFNFQKDFKEELSQLSLILNEDEFDLKALVDEKKVEVTWVNEWPHFRIQDISKIKEIFEADENVLSLKIKTAKGTTFEGVNLISYTGREAYGCFNLVGAASFNLKVPVYQGSKDFAKWQHMFNWKVLGIGKDRNYIQPFTLNISSTVKNFYN